MTLFIVVNSVKVQDYALLSVDIAMYTLTLLCHSPEQCRTIDVLLRFYLFG